MIGFVDVAETCDIALGESPINPSQQWLSGKMLGSLLRAELAATKASMLEANQSTWTLTLERLDAHNVGQFIALWQATVAIAGRLLEVNPYNQPGVELGKQLTRDSLTNI